MTFTWDLKRGEELAKLWSQVAPTSIGGPATGAAGGVFVPGRYLKPGYVITSRGCPNRCWFCSVWKREGHVVRELPIVDGWNVMDDNLLACSEKHIRGVFNMLGGYKSKSEFTGGLEAARLTDWHVDLLADLKPHQAFFAYDTPDDYEPLVEAGKKLWKADSRIGRSHNYRAYVLIGYPKDTFAAAERRCRAAWKAGFFPMAMLYNAHDGNQPPEWKSFQRQWANPYIIATSLKDRRAAG